MRIVIPSMKRANEVHTLNSLYEHEGIPYEVVLYVPPDEVETYEASVGKKYPSVKIHGCSAKGIGATRQAILEDAVIGGDPYVVMMDDDLRFFRRRRVDELRMLAAGEMPFMLERLEKALHEGYVHASISGRLRNNDIPEEFREVHRPYRVYAYDASVVLGEGLRFNFADGFANNMDDFHMTLSLIELGYPNWVWFEFAQEHRSSHAPGGASSYMSIEHHNQCAFKLHEAHPQWVKVVDKQTSTSWGGQPRKDVIIQWKKAFCSREAERKLFRD